MKTILGYILLSAAGLLLNSGCESGGAYAPVNTAKYNLERESKFVLLDRGAQRSITSAGLQESKTTDGRLQVTANVRNRENRRIEVQINCEFKDAQGFAVESTPFQTQIFTENETKAISFVAMDTRASTYTIRVRQSR